MLAGLEEVNEGSILIGDRNVTDVPPKDRDIAMVFQNYALYPHMTVRDNMAFSLALKRSTREASSSAIATSRTFRRRIATSRWSSRTTPSTRT